MAGTRSDAPTAVGEAAAIAPAAHLPATIADAQSDSPTAVGGVSAIAPTTDNTSAIPLTSRQYALLYDAEFERLVHNTKQLIVAKLRELEDDDDTVVDNTNARPGPNEDGEDETTGQFSGHDPFESTYGKITYWDFEAVRDFKSFISICMRRRLFLNPYGLHPGMYAMLGLGLMGTILFEKSAAPVRRMTRITFHYLELKRDNMLETRYLGGIADRMMRPLELQTGYWSIVVQLVLFFFPALIANLEQYHQESLALRESS
ncbi:hypothetical protein P280DRAFT_467012 [Massarina eburnea CBS 473.64]|uniref:Uncharacterized protein n=1 Tax=Massarina eburnea CBS 473.64 TaxID=1395130 RepID=A0A6A6SD94_9PLEO|nr:hypothetical protein P280DRAFT_467012 [Massarina eburnea CBS 473.64]